MNPDRTLATLGRDDSDRVVLTQADSGDYAVRLHGYGADGALTIFFASNIGHRGEILALGRAIVEALDPMPDPDESPRQRLAAWDLIADHPFFAQAYASEGPLIDAMLEQLDGLVDQPSAEPDPEACTCPPGEIGELEYVPAEPRLPLDVEIRTIALDAAVRVLDQTGGSLVEGAAKVERFLLGQQDESVEDAPRWTIGQELTEADLEELPVGAVVRDCDGDESDKREVVSRTDRPWSRGNGSARRLGAGFLHPRTVVDYPPVTLVSLP